MNNIKKMFIFGVTLPLLLAFLNYQFSSIQIFAWGHDRINEISIAAFTVIIIFSIIISILNRRMNINSKLWYSVSLLLILGSLFYIYIIYSLSHFGF